uniref:Uncharacterized protein n=1 Tax=Opuntia streptacantha TaxID=393608 RepID=A0A7C9AV89_OPUST
MESWIYSLFPGSRHVARMASCFDCTVVCWTILARLVYQLKGMRSSLCWHCILDLLQVGLICICLGDSLHFGFPCSCLQQVLAQAIVSMINGQKAQLRHMTESFEHEAA